MRKWLGLCLALLLTMTCFAACAENAVSVPGAAADEPTAADEAPASSDETVFWNYGVPMSELYSDYVRLVNRQNLLEKSDEPTDLVKLKGVKSATSATIQLREIAADALYGMFAAAAESGYTLYVKSGYRSYGTQTTTYGNYLARNNNVDDGVVAPPGASEHQTGLSCDILNKDYAGRSRMTTDFCETAEAKWMAENCVSYGFVIRYPEDKTEITETIYEPWHLRYVGKTVAGYLYLNDLTLEEFTDEWQLAVAEFLGQGGDIDAQIALEEADDSAAMESTILDVYGEDGDNEVSLSF